MFVKEKLSRVNEFMTLAHETCNQIKKYIDECQAKCEEKWKQVLMQ